MKYVLLITGLLAALAAAVPMPQADRRDGTTEFDPDYGFKNKRDGATEFDPDYGFKK